VSPRADPRAPLAPTAPVTVLAGVGPTRAAALARLGVRTVGDLLGLVPRRLERRGVRRTVREAVAAGPGPDEVAVVGTLRALRLFRPARRRTVLSLDLVDATGSLRALFFNQPWQFERLRALAAAGKSVELEGRLGTSGSELALLAPRVDAEPPATRTPSWTPVYPTAAGLGAEWLRELVRSVLAALGAALEDPLPAATRVALGLPALGDALAALHLPPSPEAFEDARRRIGFERLLALQARLARARVSVSSARAVALDEAAREDLVARLPFTPTAGQRRVLDEILDDLARPRAMRRLLQGEVGAGKTLVALAACAAVARAGGQAALLVPTELLGEQHHLGLAPALERFGLRAVLLTGSRKGAARRAALEELASGRAQLAIGTHALLGPAVRFARLDLVVIDEQQRFGVAQKRALLDKGRDVHALLMSATPIPRTLALCYYGDLETSLLAERPPGRGTVTTRVVESTGDRTGLVAHLVERARAGERIFWVCPRIVEPEPEEEGPREGAEEGRDSRAQVASAEGARERLAATPLAEHGLELLHGRMPPERRAQAVERFRGGTSRVLVATSMIEVGVDVPEATVLVVEDAERFGLAQLHQLRGRIGRGTRDSWCYLIGAEAARGRLEFLAACADGFRVAEEDLRQRGMGDLTGLRQAGENQEGLDDSVPALEWVLAARDLVREDPELCARYLGAEEGAALV